MIDMQLHQLGAMVRSHSPGHFVHGAPAGAVKLREHVEQWLAIGALAALVLFNWSRGTAQRRIRPDARATSPPPR
jgi:hypothetical protein